MNEPENQTSDEYAYRDLDDAETRVPLQNGFFFSVSVKKLVVMSVFSAGLYIIYWLYQNWKIIKERESLQIQPLLRGIFGYFFVIQLFYKINAAGQTMNAQKQLNPLLLGVGWIVVSLLYRLPDPYWLVVFLSFVFIVPVQQLINEINQAGNPNFVMNSRFSALNVVVIVLGAVLLALVLFGMVLPS